MKLKISPILCHRYLQSKTQVNFVAKSVEVFRKVKGRYFQVADAQELYSTYATPPKQNVLLQPPFHSPHTVMGKGLGSSAKPICIKKGCCDLFSSVEIRAGAWASQICPVPLFPWEAFALHPSSVHVFESTYISAHRPSLSYSPWQGWFHHSCCGRSRREEEKVEEEEKKVISILLCHLCSHIFARFLLLWRHCFTLWTALRRMSLYSSLVISFFW